MSDSFKASNGWYIDEDGVLREANGRCVGYGGDVDRLREFFQELRDHELGRWRDLLSPDCVVYDAGVHEGTRWCRVVNEKTGQSENHSEAYAATGIAVHMSVACRHFEAHPQHKPWHDAKAGEVWVLTFGDRVPDHAYLATDYGTFDSHSAEFSMNDPQIVDARCIWPEGGGDE